MHRSDRFAIVRRDRGRRRSPPWQSAWLGWAWYESRLPATYSVMDYAIPDDGGGAPVGDGTAMSHTHGGRRSSTSRAARRPAAAVHADGEDGLVRLASGRTVAALSFNGTVPGPELRVREGELVEVTLRNRDVAGGVTVHWHGVDVPQRRGRRGRRDAGCRASRRELRLSLPGHAGRNVLVPRAPGVGRPRSAAGSTAPS